MSGPDPAVAATRVAVRRALAELVTVQDASQRTPLSQRGPVVVACSGGADSLALAAAAAVETAGRGVRCAAVVVDHALQPDSQDVAATAAEQCRSLGIGQVQVVRVSVERAGHGPEAAARQARLAALAEAAEHLGSPAVLLGHTRDDQAEQVLLGLARGSGAGSLSGMPAQRLLSSGSSTVALVRPFLQVSRAQTAAACAAQGLVPWQDPHNLDPAYARVRARRAVDLLEASLGPGLAAALARSADLLRDDASALDALADAAYQGLGPPPWEVGDLLAMAPAVRRRVWRRFALACGAPPGSLTAGHLAACDALLTGWHGQGPVDLPGGRRVVRSAGRVGSVRRAQD